MMPVWCAHVRTISEWAFPWDVSLTVHRTRDQVATRICTPHKHAYTLIFGEALAIASVLLCQSRVEFPQFVMSWDLLPHATVYFCVCEHGRVCFPPNGARLRVLTLLAQRQQSPGLNRNRLKGADAHARQHLELWLYWGCQLVFIHVSNLFLVFFVCVCWMRLSQGCTNCTGRWKNDR